MGTPIHSGAVHVQTVNASLHSITEIHICFMLVIKMFREKPFIVLNVNTLLKHLIGKDERSESVFSKIRKLVLRTAKFRFTSFTSTPRTTRQAEMVREMNF